MNTITCVIIISNIEIFIKLTAKISLYDERKAKFEAWFLALTKAHIFNFIRDKNRYNNRIVVDEEAVLSYGDNDYRELEDTLCDLEKLMGQEMYVIYILRTAYSVSYFHTKWNSKNEKSRVDKSP